MLPQHWLDKVATLLKKRVKIHLTFAFVGVVTGNLRVMVETIPIYGCIDSSKKTQIRAGYDRITKSTLIQFMTDADQNTVVFARFSLNSP